jgi:hypothetical protein
LGAYGFHPSAILGEYGTRWEAIAVRLTIRGQLKARFVEAEAAAREAFDDDVALVIEVVPRGEGAFADVFCSGTIDVRATGVQPRDGPQISSHRRLAGTPYLLPDTVDARYDAAIGAGYRTVERRLEQVGSLLRWRFGMYGDDEIFGSLRVHVIGSEQGDQELRALGEVAMGDDRSGIPSGGLAEMRELVLAGGDEPLAHQLWREAWNLRLSNPRSALVIGIAAAEVGFKQLVAELVPSARWLVQELQTPPLVAMIKHYLAELPIRATVRGRERCPPHLRGVLDAAIKDRNRLVHRGSTPSVNLHGTLLAVRDLLYLFDLYAGNEWARQHLSDETLEAVGGS